MLKFASDLFVNYNKVDSCLSMERIISFRLVFLGGQVFLSNRFLAFKLLNNFGFSS